jgi:hypothetical protein
MNTAVSLRLTGIGKRFPGVICLPPAADVEDFEIRHH